MEPLMPGDPDRVGDYRLLGRLGAGGMGVVYAGRSPGGRTVAVKVVRERFAGDPQFRARFRREVAAAREVTGTFTAPVLDADPDAAAPWLVTAYLPGLTLWEAVGTFGALPSPAVRALAAGLAEAVADIHRAGLTHRDLKPGNIMLTADGPRVIDFGIARPEDVTAITRVGALIGTPGFMSPEQAARRVAGPPSDVFSLGAVLVYAAIGREPFRAADTVATLRQVEEAQVDLRGIPDDGLSELVAACLRREPEQRPSAVQLLDRLGEGPASEPGAGWLPAPLAEAIDRRAGPGSVGVSDEPAVTPVGGETVEPPALGDVPETAAGPWRPSRRELLVSGAVLAAGGGVALVLGRDEDAPGSTSAPKPTRPTATAPPPTAARRWRTKVSDYYPTVFTADGVLVAQADEEETRALDVRTGKTLWKEQASNGSKTLGDVVYLSRAIKPWLTAADASSGDVRWQASYPEPAVHMAVAGSVVCFGYEDRLRAVGLEDGRSRWVRDIDPKAGLAADADLVAVVNATTLTGLEPRSGRTRWTYPLDLGNTLLSALLISDGLVFVGDRNRTLHAVRVEDGTPAWKMPPSSRWANASSLQSAGGTLYANDGLGNVVAMNATTGERRWSRFLDADSALALSGTTVLAACASKKTLYALNAADGRVVWSYRADIEEQSAPASTAGLVFIGTRSGHVEALAPPAGGTRAGS